MMKVQLILVLLLFSLSSFAQIGAKVTYLANDGFMIEHAGSKIIIDGVFGNIHEAWCDSPSDSLIELLQQSEAPFKGVEIVAVTHYHRDHFNSTLMMSFLKQHSETTLICPKQVDSILQLERDYGRIRKQIIAITPEFLKDSVLHVADMEVRILRLEHSHYLVEDTITGEAWNKHRKVENIGFVFKLDSLSFFHSGDANPLNEEEFKTFRLDKEELDIAFLDRMFLTYGKLSIATINAYIKPDKFVLMHIRPSNRDLFIKHFEKFKEYIIFEKEMQVVAF